MGDKESQQHYWSMQPIRPSNGEMCGTMSWDHFCCCAADALSTPRACDWRRKRPDKQRLRHTDGRACCGPFGPAAPRGTRSTIVNHSRALTTRTRPVTTLSTLGIAPRPGIRADIYQCLTIRLTGRVRVGGALCAVSTKKFPSPEPRWFIFGHPCPSTT
jgi:hypothetical protein